MFLKKAIVLSLFWVLLMPCMAWAQQNGSKTPPKTKVQATPKKPAAKPAQSGKQAAKPASNSSKSQGKTQDDKKQATDKKKTAQPAPPELQKLLGDLLDKDRQQKEENRLIYEIDGLLIDETLTKTGHDYYDIFYSNWEAPEKVTDFTVRIIERPLRGRGFQIVVSVNDVEIIEENLQPRYDMLEAAAQNAVFTVRDYLLNYENLKNQIESDDQQGTGLF